MPLPFFNRSSMLQALILLVCLAGPVLAVFAGSPGRASAAPAILHGNSPPALECFDLASRSLPPPQRAIAVCTKALETRTLDEATQAATLVNRALIQRRLGRVAAAAADCDTAIALGTSTPEAAVTCAAVYIDADAPDRAIALLDSAPLPDASQRHKAFHNLALAHHDLGQYREAYHFIERTLEAKPHFAPALDLKQQYRAVRSPIAK